MEHCIETMRVKIAIAIECEVRHMLNTIDTGGGREREKT
jgi:hypothetical protein